jgi:hypothetical protein
MAGKKRNQGQQVSDFRHEDAKRKNNPPAGIAPIYEARESQRTTYAKECAQKFGLVGRDDALKDPLVMEEVLRRAKNGFGKESHTLRRVVEKIISCTTQEA